MVQRRDEAAHPAFPAIVFLVQSGMGKTGLEVTDDLAEMA
jgi:hypothetical protein